MHKKVGKRSFRVDVQIDEKAEGWGFFRDRNIKWGEETLQKSWLFQLYGCGTTYLHGR